MPNRVPTLSLILLAMSMAYSCSRPITADELIGSWEIYSYGYEELPFYQYDFGTGEVTVAGEYMNAQRADYACENGEITISHNGWSRDFTLVVDHLIEDTLYLNGGTKLIRVEAGHIWPVYDLPSISGGEPLPVREKDVQYGVFHYYHTKGDDAPSLRFGDRTISTDEISFALSIGHAKRVDVLLFADRTITVAELHELYLSLAASRFRKVYIVSGQYDYDGLTYMKDYYHIWYNDLRELRPGAPPPPPSLTVSREDYLKLPTSRQIDILAVSDTSVVTNLSIDFEYLFLIDSDLNLQEYLEIKRCLSAARKRNGLRFVIDLGS